MKQSSAMMNAHPVTPHEQKGCEDMENRRTVRFWHRLTEWAREAFALGGEYDRISNWDEEAWEDWEIWESEGC